MAGNPDILQCDESTSGCDVFTRELVRKVLVEYASADNGNRCVLVSTHYEDDVEILAHRVWFLNERFLILDEDVDAILSRHRDLSESMLFSSSDERVKRYFAEWFRKFGHPVEIHGELSLT